MTLQRWLKQQGRGAQTALQLATGIPRSTLNRICDRTIEPSLTNAMKIVKASGGKVGLGSLRVTA